MTTKMRESTRGTNSDRARKTLQDAAAGHRQPRLTYLFGQIDRVVSRRLTEALSVHGLTLPQFTTLSVLDARGQATNAQLAERSLITPQSTNEVVKTMEINGWVMRETDPANRRIVLLRLTPTGKALLKRCDEAVDRMERSMLHDIGESDAQTLHTLVLRCVRNLQSS